MMVLLQIFFFPLYHLVLNPLMYYLQLKVWWYLQLTCLYKSNWIPLNVIFINFTSFKILIFYTLIWFPNNMQFNYSNNKIQRYSYIIFIYSLNILFIFSLNKFSFEKLSLFLLIFLSIYL